MTPVSTRSSVSPPQTEAKSSRFSFSKLTKFVSRSALKVMNRKTSTDSLGGSIDDSTSSHDDSNTSIHNYDEENNQMHKLAHLQASRNAAFKTSMPQSTAYATNVAKRRPVMGLTALMITKHKQQQQKLTQQYGMYGMTTGMCSMMPNLYLVGLPIVFNTASFRKEDEEKASASNYDRLARVNPANSSSNVQEIVTQKQQTPSRLGVKTAPNSTPSSAAYSMSVFSKSASALKSGKQLTASDLYDSISEAVF